ncbi:creatininase family protein [Alphaproteobacteria bacterium KMM 3653]|uniref:Creatininase family protein n=1 Tax=Harenicola maris TaxID=2841044 RepID=A0AAP2CN48_9RHOB|nr:creatininase family protein [Harenicola maris]
MSRRRIWWDEFGVRDFDSIDPERTIAMLPIAATEQHGPHLPLCTDSALTKGMIETVAEGLPADVDLRVLPIQRVGKSDEHLFARGTLSLDAHGLIDTWTALGAQVARAGIRKLILMNSHGGNEEVMGIVARNLRVQEGLLVIKTSWLRFGHPEGLYDAQELRHGIHGGDIETSLMLHFRPDLVDMKRAGDFTSRNVEIAAGNALLNATGPHGFGWIAADLNESGAIGNAAAATADKGAASARWAAAGFFDLLADVIRTDPSKIFSAKEACL